MSYNINTKDGFATDGEENLRIGAEPQRFGGREQVRMQRPSTSLQIHRGEQEDVRPDWYRNGTPATSRNR